MGKPYILLQIDRANRDAAGFVRDHLKWTGLTFLASLAGAPAYLALNRNADMSGQVLQIACYGLIGPAVVLVGGWLYFFFSAPGKMHAAGAGIVSALPTDVFYVRSWDRVNPLALYQAACLWLGLSPPTSSKEALPDAARPLLQRFMQAVERGRLPIAKEPPAPPGRPYAIVISDGKATADTKIDRETWRLFAEVNDERPAFLFPEDDEAPSSPLSLTLDVEPLRGLLYGSENSPAEAGPLPPQ